jgi:Fur family ferric uptake transcriptional regulator
VTPRRRRTPRPDSELDAIHLRVGARLTDDGQRYTAGRRALVGALASARGPLTVPDLAALAPELPASSMYRNLEVLERSTLVRRLPAVGDHACWEMSEPLVAHHHHLVCGRCGTIEDVVLDDATEAALEATLSTLAADAGFVPAEHVVDLHGTCRDCR